MAFGAVIGAATGQISKWFSKTPQPKIPNSPNTTNSETIGKVTIDEIQGEMPFYNDGVNSYKGGSIQMVSQEDLIKFQTIDNFTGTTLEATDPKWVSGIKWASELTGHHTWTEAPLRAVNVGGRLVVIDGNHRLQAALSFGFKGSIPYIPVSVENSGYSLRELFMFLPPK